MLRYNTIDYAAGEAEAGIDEDEGSAADGAGVDSTETFLRGFFNSSKVTPSNFVIPTTGASPFLTNSYMPKEKAAC